MNREERAVDAVLDCVATAIGVPSMMSRVIREDDDFVTDLGMDWIELESLALIIEEAFGIPPVPGSLFKTSLFRTASALAEWAILQTTSAAWSAARTARRA